MRPVGGRHLVAHGTVARLERTGLQQCFCLSRTAAADPPTGIRLRERVTGWLPKRALAAGDAVGGAGLVAAIRLVGHWGRTEAVGAE